MRSDVRMVNKIIVSNNVNRIDLSYDLLIVDLLIDN